MSNKLYLFANNNGGQAENNGSYRLYDMKIEGSAEARRDFQPVLDSNNIPCLLDKVNNKFYYDKNGKVFSTRDKIVKRIKYIIVQDNAISIGNFTINENTRLKFKVSVGSNSKSGSTRPASIVNFNGAYDYGWSIGQDNNQNVNGLNLTYNGTGSTEWIRFDAKKYIEVDVKGKNISIDGINYVSSVLPDSFSYSGMLTLGKGVNWGGYTGVTKINYFQIYQSEELLFDGKAMLDQSNIPCIYDKISDTYFYQKDQDTIVYEIEEMEVQDENYTPIEYIESNGTQYIDTGVVPAANTKIDMTCRLSAKPYICFKNKCDTRTISLSEDTIIEMDFKYGGTRLGDSRALENYLYILADGSYSLDGSTSTGVLASTTHYDNLKFILSSTEGKEYLYVNGIKVGEKTISSLSRLKFGGTYNNCATFYTHYANVYKKSDLTPIPILTPVINDYAFSSPVYSYTYHIPKLYNSITGKYYMTIYGDALGNEYIEYGYDKNYIYNNLKLLNISKTQYSEASNSTWRKKIYDRIVYEYKGVNTTVQPNLTASTGATLTIGSQNIAYLTEEELAQAVLNGWTIQ